MKVPTEAWSRLDRWLAEHAPRTHATLLPPLAPEVVRAAVAAVGRSAPEALVALYGCAGGQHDDARGAERVAHGIFDGYWFMPLDGVDGLAQALADWKTAMDAGAAWATPNRFPFAKDFAGAYLCIETPDDPDDEIRIVEAGDCELEEVTQGLEWFIDRTAEYLEERDVIIDERVFERELHEVLFDACRPREVGDAAKHSVFEKLGIEASVEDLTETFSMFDKPPAQVFGLAVRLVTSGKIEIDGVALVDPYDAPLAAHVGSMTGGGKPGVVVYVREAKPLPERARLRVIIASIRPRAE